MPSTCRPSTLRRKNIHRCQARPDDECGERSAVCQCFGRNIDAYPLEAHMSSHRVLVAYGTKYGQAAKIAGRIAGQLSLAGKHVTLVNADAPPAGLSVAEFDGVIVGSSIIVGKH